MSTAQVASRSRARPSRFVAHSLLAVIALVWLASESTPGDVFLLGMLVFVCVPLSVVVWTGWVIKVAFARQWTAWVLVAPVIGVVTGALLLAEAPLKARWAVSHGAFDRLVDQLGPAADSAAWEAAPVRQRVGTFDITHGFRVRGGYILYEANGFGMADDAGFAYYPSGVPDGLGNGDFEDPQFRALGDGWYAWTASW